MRRKIVVILIGAIWVTVNSSILFAGIHKKDVLNCQIGGFIATGDKAKYKNEGNGQIYDLDPKDFAKFALGIGIEYEKNESLCFPLTLELFIEGDKEYPWTFTWVRDGKTYPGNDKVEIQYIALTGEGRYKFNKGKNKNITPYLGVGTGLYWWSVKLEYDYYYETESPGWYYLWKKREEKTKRGIDFGFHLTAGILHTNKFFLEGRYRILKTDIGDGLSYDGFQIVLGYQL